MANGHAYATLIVDGPPSHPCAHCRETPPRVDFYSRKRSANGRLYWDGVCKQCRRDGRRDRDAALDPIAKRSRERRYALNKRYGMTEEAWATLWAEQGERCGCCGALETDGKFWHVDHDHATGKVRGILCHGCNTGLGNFGDDVDRLRAAIDYLTGRDSG